MSVENSPISEATVMRSPREPIKRIQDIPFQRRGFLRGVAALPLAGVVAEALTACSKNQDFKERIRLPDTFVFTSELQEGEQDEANHILATKLLNDKHWPWEGYTKDDFTKDRIDLEKKRVEKILSSGDFGQMYRGFWYIHTNSAREMLLDGLTYIRENTNFGEDLPQLPEELKKWCKDHLIRKEVLAMCRDRRDDTIAFLGKIKEEIGRKNDDPRMMMINCGGAASVLHWETNNFERVGDRYTARYWENRVKELKNRREMNSKDENVRKKAQAAYDEALQHKEDFYTYITRLSEMTGLTYDPENIAGGPTGEIGHQVMPSNLIKFDDKMQNGGERFNVYSGTKYYDFICLMFAERFFDGNWEIDSPGYIRGDGTYEAAAREDAMSRYNPRNPDETTFIINTTNSYAKVVSDNSLSH